MKNILIIGFGEAGKGIYGVVKDSSSYKIFTKDAEELEIKEKIAVMHICLPFIDNFIGVVADYIKKYTPELTIIESTVGPGTTDEIYKKTKKLVVHSPIRARHPNMKIGLLRFIKFIGPTSKEAGELARKYYESLGLKAEVMDNALNTEAGKLLCTTYYAANIALHQDMERICKKLGADFKQSVTRFNETCTIDKDYKIPRPVLYPGYIGGHCLIPNIRILQKHVNTDFLNDILKSNEMKKKELEENSEKSG